MLYTTDHFKTLQDGGLFIHLNAIHVYMYEIWRSLIAVEKLSGAQYQIWPSSVYADNAWLRTHLKPPAAMTSIERSVALEKHKV